jgi:hypothetical protein
VLLLTWNTATDHVEAGQWLKGRIYERRCDLTPEGDLLLYFAASYRPPYFSWSALSRPPYLTALALWPKGDGWGGGGEFKERKVLALNHRETEMTLAKGFRVPNWLSVEEFGPGSGWGEDEPVWWRRLERDGWTLVSEGREASRDFARKVWIQFEPPVVWERTHPIEATRYVLQMTLRGIRERSGPWYLTEHSVVADDGKRHDLGRSDWADWSRSGDLLFSRQSSLWRLPYANGSLAPLNEACEIVNLGPLSFEPRDAPRLARQWPKA